MYSRFMFLFIFSLLFCITFLNAEQLDSLNDSSNNYFGTPKNTLRLAARLSWPHGYIMDKERNLGEELQITYTWSDGHTEIAKSKLYGFGFLLFYQRMLMRKLFVGSFFDFEFYQSGIDAGGGLYERVFERKNLFYGFTGGAALSYDLISARGSSFDRILYAYIFPGVQYSIYSPYAVIHNSKIFKQNTINPETSLKQVGPWAQIGFGISIWSHDKVKAGFEIVPGLTISYSKFQKQVWGKSSMLTYSPCFSIRVPLGAIGW